MEQVPCVLHMHEALTRAARGDTVWDPILRRRLTGRLCVLGAVAAVFVFVFASFKCRASPTVGQYPFSLAPSGSFLLVYIVPRTGLVQKCKRTQKGY
jgi:hypothetical protein